ncbi:hypothetical protein ACO1O0_000785 [Amphichorda felina]
MKYTYGAALAALIGTAAAKDDRTFAVLRFNNKALTKGRMDPIISPGQTSQHVHTVMGGSGFGKGATGDDLMNSQCSTAKIKGDNSAYWFPSLYFKDPNTGKFEDVGVDYVNVYYFFEATDDEIKAFPPGLQIVGGNAMTRTAPQSAETNLDPSKGEIMNVKWTCPRLGNEYNPPSWKANSDGTKSGMGDPINKGEGVGFPDVNCDGYGSPLRADIHMPSCYNPEAGLTNYKKNMAWPEDNGSGKLNCPQGYIHLPHLFYEIYWDTPSFADRWTGNAGQQPFVLSNGDVTGYSSHADFMAGWDEDLLQHIIDTCNAGTEGMDLCPGINGLNEDDCTIPSEVDEKVEGVLDALPGHLSLLGWSFGLDGLADLGKNVDSAPKSTSKTAPSAAASKGAVFVEKPQATTSVPAPAQTKAPTKNAKTFFTTITRTLPAKAAPTEDVNATGDETGAVAGFQYAGCFRDSEARVLRDIVRPDIGKVSNEKCVSHCKGAGFLLAGTEWSGECYCGNELLGSEQIDEKQCSHPCADNGTETCGGDWALSVYSESGKASIKTSKAHRHLHGHGQRRSHHY